MRHLTIACCTLLASAACTQDADTLQATLGDTDIADGWIYEDIEAGYAEANKTGKPLLVAFR